MSSNSIEFRHTKDISPMRDIIVFLSRIDRTKLILALLAIDYMNGWVIWGLLHLFEPEFIKFVESSPYIDESLPLTFQIAVTDIFGPFLETLIFQFIVLIIVKKCSDWITKSNSWTYSFFITSLLFAAAHATDYGPNYYGLLRALAVIIPGSLFTILAIVEFEREKGHPILFVWILHGLSNFLITLEELIFF